MAADDRGDGHAAEELILVERDTIFALSSGAPPSAIAIVRVSGPEAGKALRGLAGLLPEPRRAILAALHHPETAEILDRALLLWFPGPNTATGEDLAELHLHGGRAVVSAVLAALSEMVGLRAAEAGEFTRRAFFNGVMDLTSVEGLSDLLAAQTEAERRNAIALAEGGLARDVRRWREQVLALSARAEAALDFEDEADVASQDDQLAEKCRALARELDKRLASPPAERLREGVKVVLAGPVNSGKSTLLNRLVASEAAIVTDEPGTTRDIIEVAVDLGGIPFRFSDTAGLRQASDVVERIGIQRALEAIAGADLVLWLGEAGAAPDADGRLLRISSRCDVAPPSVSADFVISAVTGEGMDKFEAALVEKGRELLPRADTLALNQRQRAALKKVAEGLQLAEVGDDPLLTAEGLRLARDALDSLDGRSGVEDMLDALFSGFCIGK